MRSMFRVMLAQSGSDTVQSVFRRQDANGTIALATAPTVGNYMLLLMAGFSQATDVPAGWTTIIYGKESLGVPSAQKVWAASKLVAPGETGSIAFTGSDISNLALFELTSLTQTSAAMGTCSLAGSAFSVPFSLPAFTPTLRFIVVELDSGGSIPSYDGGQGITTLYTTSGGVNHHAAFGQVPNAFNGTVTGVFSGGTASPAYMTISVA